MAYTYMLHCADGSLYVGSTNYTLEGRVEEHNLGMGAEHTARRLPVRLVWYEEYEHIGLAYAREKQIQGWGRRKRIALTLQRYDDLPALARSRSAPREGA